MGVFNIKLNKIILFVVILLALSGCSATYNIEIKDNKVYEYAKIWDSKEGIDNKIEKNGYSLKEEMDITFNNIHDKNNGQEEVKTRSFNLNKINDDLYYGISYENSFDLEKYNNSPLLQQCYKDVTINVEDNIIVINSSNYFNCFDYYGYLDNVNIKLTTNYVSLSNNADKVNENEYNWIITKDNYKNKSIYIELDKTKYLLTEEKVDKLLNIILIILGGLALIFGIFVFIKIKKSNK